MAPGSLTEKQSDNIAITSIFILWLHSEPLHEGTELEYTLEEIIQSLCVRGHYYSKWLERLSA